MPTTEERVRRLKAGTSEIQKMGGYKVSLYWEVWRTDMEIRREERPRARFIVELEHVSGRQESKRAFDDFEEADKAFTDVLRKHAVSLAAEALGFFDPPTNRRR